MSKPYAYVCLWKFSDKTPYAFILADCYGIDDQGYACTKSQFARIDRYSYHNWVNENVWYKKIGPNKFEMSKEPIDDLEPETQAIAGRVVTTWTWLRGVKLAAFNPPDTSSWLSSNFVEDIIKMDNWPYFIQNGFDLLSGTAKAVQDLILEETKAKKAI